MKYLIAILILTAILISVCIAQQSITPPYNSFNGGVLSDRGEAWIENPKYRNSLRQSENFLQLKEGPVSKRPGTVYTGGLVDPNDTARMIPFVFSTDDSYVLVFDPNGVDDNGTVGFLRTTNGVSGSVQE